MRCCKPCSESDCPRIHANNKLIVLHLSLRAAEGGEAISIGLLRALRALAMTVTLKSNIVEKGLVEIRVIRGGRIHESCNN